MAEIAHSGVMTSPETGLTSELLQLASERRIVPCLAAGTTRSLIGQWPELCQALRDKAKEESFVPTGDGTSTST